jgi:hypothetical protein
VTEIGGTTGIAVARPVGAAAYIYGASTAWMKFPVGILPSSEYTLFFVARYNGLTRGRIFMGAHKDWFSGFWEGARGVAHHGSCFFISSSINQHGNEWLIGTDRSNSFRSNGVDRSTEAQCDEFDRLMINSGGKKPDSDFAVQSVLVYNRKLKDADVVKVEAWLTSLQPVFTPATLQASAHVRRRRMYYIDSFCHVVDHSNIFKINLFRSFQHSRSIIDAIITTASSLTISFRALSDSMTRKISLPATVSALGPLARAFSAPSRARPTSATTGGS